MSPFAAMLAAQAAAATATHSEAFDLLSAAPEAEPSATERTLFEHVREYIRHGVGVTLPAFELTWFRPQHPDVAAGFVWPGQPIRMKLAVGLDRRAFVATELHECWHTLDANCPALSIDEREHRADTFAAAWLARCLKYLDYRTAASAATSGRSAVTPRQLAAAPGEVLHEGVLPGIILPPRAGAPGWRTN